MNSSGFFAAYSNQSATSMPFYGGLALLSAAALDAQVRYAAIPLYATVALSLAKRRPGLGS